MQSMKILEGDGVLLSQPLLIEQFGRAGAQFLSQLHYWLNHQNQKVGVSSDGIRWIYNSAKDWAEQLCFSSRTIQRLIHSLSELEVLEVKKLSANKHNRINHYTINYEILENLISNNTKTVKRGENLITTKCRNGSRQSDVMYIQRLPNKDLNKSEVSSAKQISEQIHEEKQVDLVKQVKKIKPINDLKIKNNQIFHKQENAVNNQTIELKQAEKTPKKKEPKTSITQDMLGIWNTILGEKAQAAMSKELAPLLVSAYGKKFERKLDQWKKYCLLIKSSSYLMGDRFKLSIFWALKFSTIDRIRSGNLGVNVESIIENSDNNVLNDQQIELMIENLSESERAKEMRRKITKAVGAPMYISWFHQAQFADREGDIQLIAPNSFVEQYWKTHFDWLGQKY
jgi:hypothetical protein